MSETVPAGDPGTGRTMGLVRPQAHHLASFVSALDRGWWPDSTRGAEAAREEVERVQRDPALYLERLINRTGGGEPVVLPDGSQVPRLPGVRYWLWDGEFCGVIGLRWQPGAAELPPYVLGHVGYNVVPWRRRRGYATAALRQMLPIARAEGLPWIDLTTDPDNVASQKVIAANGGVLVERFTKDAAYGGTPGLRFRIRL